MGQEINEVEVSDYKNPNDSLSKPFTTIGLIQPNNYYEPMIILGESFQDDLNQTNIKNNNNNEYVTSCLVFSLFILAIIVLLIIIIIYN